MPNNSVSWYPPDTLYGTDDITIFYPRHVTY